jgi:hypothetical protein
MSNSQDLSLLVECPAAKMQIVPFGKFLTIRKNSTG